LETPLGTGLRHEHGAWPAASPRSQERPPVPQRTVSLPDLPPMPSRERILSPTALGGAKALPGEGDETERALARGRAIHALLEQLPEVPPARREAHGRALLEVLGLDADEAGQCLSEAVKVLASPDLAEVFAPGALVEVALSGQWRGRPIWGIIDRLVITPARVLAVDFKSNRVVPASADAVPEGILRQMGAYHQMLSAQYPERQVDLALLWTATARLMPLDPAMLEAALDRAALDHAAVPS